MLILLFMIFILLALIDVPWLVRKEYWWELAVYSGLMLTALIICVMMVMDVIFPAVSTEIGNFIRSIFQL